MSTDLTSLKNELNGEQFKAVTLINGAILIIAGAGSGKTRVITYRIAHMLDEGIPQSQILALTFTNKAAREMESRVKELTGKKLQNLTVSTFHAFGVRILRNEIEKLGYRENFSIYDETDKIALIKECGRELKFSPDKIDAYKICQLFSSIKTGRKNWKNANDAYKPLYESYQDGLKLYNAVDFDDLIVLPIKLFKENPDVLKKYKERYKYIMVDEFQDTSHQQYELMHLLADKNVCVVGDDDQSIYSWRGADYQNIVNFEKDFNVTEIRLEQNYRSTETILEAANGVISHNTNRKDKKLWSGNGNGKPIEVFLPQNETDEAEFIAESIQGIAMEERLKYDDFGVLIRANTQSRFIEEAFLEANIPYTMSGGTSFFERQEIKDIVSYLRVIANHDDDINLLRILNTPRRGIGRATIKIISDKAKLTSTPLYTAIKTILDTAKSETGVEGGLWSLSEACTEQSRSDETSDGVSESTSPVTSTSKTVTSTSKPVTSSEACTERSRSVERSTRSVSQSDFSANARNDNISANLSPSAIDALSAFVEIIEENREKMLHGRGLAKKVRELIEEIDYKSHLMTEFAKSEKSVRFKMMNIESFLNSIETWENDPDNANPTLFNYLNRITLLSRDDDEDGEKGKVQLMTIHAAKGLEFPVVFIAGAEEGLIPHQHSLDESDDDFIESDNRQNEGGRNSTATKTHDSIGNATVTKNATNTTKIDPIEEERRLFYVAITRARDKLLISSCQKRKKMQMVVDCVPSRFLDEIPENLVEYHKTSEPVTEEKAMSFFSNILNGLGK